MVCKRKKEIHSLNVVQKKNVEGNQRQQTIGENLQAKELNEGQKRKELRNKKLKQQRQN